MGHSPRCHRRRSCRESPGVFSETLVEVNLSFGRRAPRPHAVETQRLRSHALETGHVGTKCVYGVFGHLPIGRPLAAGDVHDAVVRIGHLVSAREVGRAFLHYFARNGSEQRSKAGPDAGDVAVVSFDDVDAFTALSSSRLLGSAVRSSNSLVVGVRRTDVRERRPFEGTTKILRRSPGTLKTPPRRR